VRWRQKDQTIEVHNLLRQLQTIRLGCLEVGGKTLRTKVTRVPKDLNPIPNKLGLLPQFAQPPAWAPAELLQVNRDFRLRTPSIAKVGLVPVDGWDVPGQLD